MRYCGSKAKFVKQLLPIITEHLDGSNTFYDAFMGGANVICAIDYPKKIGIELNEYVCALWDAIWVSEQCNVPPESWIPDDVTREKYEDVKREYMEIGSGLPRKYCNWEIGYVGTCCSFGGAWFNGYAAYNPKKNENHILEAKNGLIKQIKAFKNLQDTAFINCSYDEQYYEPNSVIYCDPPYADTKKYESDFDHRKFWDWVRMMSKKGHYVYVSEYTAPSDFECIWQAKKHDGMGSSTTGVSKVKIEKLFVYKNA